MTYRTKIGLVVAFAAFAVLLAAGMAVWSVNATSKHIRQANLAHDLLDEHLQLSVHAYRLFKQLTDEILLGSGANQSVVRNKREAIAWSLTEIRRLELEQRETMGADFAPGAVEDTDDLEQAIELIIRDFRTATQLPPGPQRSKRVNAVLEERIDVGFRDRVNAALERQRSVVERMNVRIQRVHAQSVGIAVGLVMATLLAGLAMGWLLMRGIAVPLDTLRRAAKTWSSGEFNHRIGLSSDPEFDRITSTFNSMAEHLAEFTQQRQRTERELQHAVAERTDELSKVNEALKQADAVRREFFADVSHELRTPLTVIRGEAQVALRGQERTGADYRDALSIVLEQAVGLSRLVDDMLFIARTNAERIRLLRAPLDLQELTDAVVHESVRLAEAQKVAIRTDIDGSLGKLNADPDRVRQLLLILIDNAIRYSPSGGTVAVKAERQDNQVLLSVSDQGVGIDPQDLPHIFDRFFRGGVERGGASGTSGHQRSSTVGLGLGLAVAKAIVQAHGGDISGVSSPGQGTTITARFPVTHEIADR